MGGQIHHQPVHHGPVQGGVAFLHIPQQGKKIGVSGVVFEKAQDIVDEVEGVVIFIVTENRSIPEISKILIAQHPDELGNGGLGNIAQTGQFLNGKGRQACHILEHHQRNVIICGVRVTVIQGDQEPVIENPHGVTLLCCTYYSKVGRSAASKNSSSPWRPAQIMGVQMFWAVTLARPGQRQRTMPVILLLGIHTENLRDWMRSLLVPLFCFIFCLPGKADFDHKGNSGRSPVGRSCRVRS